MEKLVYVSFTPISETIIRNYFIEYLESKQCRVEFLYLPLLYPPNSRVNETKPGQTICSNLAAFKKHIGSCKKNSTIVLLMHREFRTRKVYSIVAQSNGKMAFFAWGQFFDKVEDGKKILQRLKDLNPYKVVNKIYARYAAKPPVWDVVFISGEKLKEQYATAKKIVNINYFDYDKFLSIRSGQKHHPEVAVFLDMYLPYHSDLDILGYNKIDAERYFSELNIFFETIEKLFKLQVVICAHPKSHYSDDFFSGRKIAKFQTAEFVRDCAFVFSHTSSSLTFGILFEKRIFFLTSDDIIKTYSTTINEAMEKMSEKLQSPLINISQKRCVTQIQSAGMEISLDAYNRFKYDFLTSPETENLYSGDVLVRYLSGS